MSKKPDLHAINDELNALDWDPPLRARGTTKTEALIEQLRKEVAAAEGRCAELQRNWVEQFDIMHKRAIDAEAALAQREAAIMQIQTFTRHQLCDLGLCITCGMSEHNPYHPKDHAFVDKGCTCGLSKLLADLGVSRTLPEEDE